MQGRAASRSTHIDLETASLLERAGTRPVRRIVGRHGLVDPQPMVSTNRTQWLVVEIAAISGRRFSVHCAADGHAVDWQLA